MRVPHPSARETRSSAMTPLPTRNSTLALRRADFRSVPEMLDYAAQGETGVTFYSVRGEILSALPWREIRERAQVTAPIWPASTIATALSVFGV